MLMFGVVPFGCWVRGKSDRCVDVGTILCRAKSSLHPRSCFNDQVGKACRQDPEPLFGKSGSGLPKTKVKTRCVRVGSIRLYAPMVPLAPHPCVRWWNTEEMPLKLTRLGLHSLKGGSSHQKPSHPVGAGCVWMVGCTSILQLRGYGGPFFDGPKNGPPHPPRKPSGQDHVF